MEKEREERKRKRREQMRERQACEREQEQTTSGGGGDVSLSQVKELVLKAIQKIDENEKAIKSLKQEMSSAR